MALLVASVFTLLVSTPKFARASSPYVDPAAVVTSPGRLWIGNEEGNRIAEIDSVNGKLVRYITSSKLKYLDAEAIDVSGSHLWVDTFNSPGQIAEFKLSDGSLVRVLKNPADDIDFPSQLVVQGSHLWVLNSSTVPSNLTELNESNGSLVRALNFPDAIAFVATKRRIWVANANGVTEVRTSDGSIVQNVSLQVLGINEPTAVATSGNRLWVTSGVSSVIAELNTSNGSLIRHIKVPFVGVTAYSSLIPFGSDVFMSTDSKHGVVIEFDQSSGKVLRVFKPPASPDFFQNFSEIAVTGNTLWVANPIIGIDEFDRTTGAFIGNIG